MASGVTVNDSVVKCFHNMKVRKCSTPEEIQMRRKIIMFCLSEDNKEIIVEENKCVTVGDLCAAEADAFDLLVKLLPDKECRYVLFDVCYETNETKKEELVFIFWAPDDSSVKYKMIYASSKDAIKKKMPGIKHEWQVNNQADLRDRGILAEKLGGANVKSLEGKPL